MKSNKDRERLVIVGNGMAGAACIEEIMALDPKRYDVTVFGAESHSNYNRVLLAEVLTGDKGVSDLELRNREWYEEHGIRLFTGKRVMRIDRGRRKVIADNGDGACYDKLVLATGSSAFIPPIPGIEKPEVFTFRTIDDCERIKSAIEGGARRAAVIGGGLLGLEAAYALKVLGVEVTVIHLTDRLMEGHLDPLTAELLREDLEAIGIRVLLATKTSEILGKERVEGLSFKDHAPIDADMVIMSAGIVPRADLARQSGIYCEKGIVVSNTMQSFDPAVYAVGECVEYRKETFGLVGPVFEQARVLANHLAGDGRLVFKSKPSSARLKVPDIELYCAGKADGDEHVETVEYLDRKSRVSKRVFISDDRIVGIVLYGETSIGPALYASLASGENVAHKRGALLFGDSIEGRLASVENMPNEAIVCGCNGVTKGAILEAIKSKGLFSRDDVTAETGAASSCGGCSVVIDQLLEVALGSNFQDAGRHPGICACTKYSREDIVRNIREKRLESVAEVMETLGWESVGCEECRPAINYYGTMIWPLEWVDDQSSRLVNERLHANIQEDGTFSVVPRIYGGAVSPNELKRIADVAVNYDVRLVKLTGGQRIDLIGVKKDDLEGVWSELKMPSGYAYAKAVRTVKSCVGSRSCRYGTQDSLGLAIEMEQYFEGLWMPAKVKMGVSGCPRNCAESSIKDVGVVGVAGGFEILVGGCGGIELKGAKRLCSVETVGEVISTTTAFLQLYREEAEYGERVYKWLERCGLEGVQAKVVNDQVSAKELAARLGVALSLRKDPWKERIAASST